MQMAFLGVAFEAFVAAQAASSKHAGSQFETAEQAGQTVDHGTDGLKIRTISHLLSYLLRYIGNLASTLYIAKRRPRDQVFLPPFTESREGRAISRRNGTALRSGAGRHSQGRAAYGCVQSHQPER